MTEYRYLIDNNALSRLSNHQRASTFFRRQCRVPSEIVYEARGYTDPGELKDVEYPTTSNLLETLREVMSTIPLGDVELVDLYANKGAADPLVVACAIHATRKNAQLLFGPTWIIVSDDKAVRSKAAEFAIETQSSDDFVALVLDQEGSSPESR